MNNYYFVRNKNFRPSTYYRIIQFIKVDTKRNYIVEYENDFYYSRPFPMSDFINKFSNLLLVGYCRRITALIKLSITKERYNLFVQREVFPKFVDPFSFFILKKVIQKANSVIWDFDDQILELNEITTKEFMLLSEKSNHILVGNKNLKEIIPSKFHSKVRILNTTDYMMSDVNLEKLNSKRLQTFEEKIIVSWIGTKGNLIHLNKVIPFIDKALEDTNKEVVLKIVSDGLLVVDTNKIELENIKWSRDIAKSVMEESHIGLMPLIETEVTKGKCAFKAVQSIGMGLPVIISNVGMNSEVINGNGYILDNFEEWGKSLLELISDSTQWEKASIKSREIWNEKFHANENLKTITDLLSDGDKK